MKHFPTDNFLALVRVRRGPAYLLVLEKFEWLFFINASIAQNFLESKRGLSLSLGFWPGDLGSLANRGKQVATATRHAWVVPFQDQLAIGGTSTNSHREIVERPPWKHRRIQWLICRTPSFFWKSHSLSFPVIREVILGRQRGRVWPYLLGVVCDPTPLCVGGRVAHDPRNMQGKKMVWQAQ